MRGYVDDLARAYASADLAVVPLAHGTGTRIKLLEALAAGVPVVTTAVGAAGLAAEHGRHLLIADDVHELSAAVARVLLDARAGRRARARRPRVRRAALQLRGRRRPAASADGAARRSGACGRSGDQLTRNEI